MPLNHPIPNDVDTKLFQLLVANVTDCAIFLIDPNGYILSWNQGAEHIKGYSAQEVIGKHVGMFYQPGDTARHHLRSNLNLALKNGTHEDEGWRVRKDGSLFWAHVVFTTLYDEQDRLIGFAKITHDITGRKVLDDRKSAINAQLEARVQERTETIRANELKFRALIENSYDGITLFNEQLEAFYRSLSAERINGWKDSDSTAPKIAEMMHPDDLNMALKWFEQVINEPRIPVLITCRLRHKSGHYIWVESVFTNWLSDPAINAIVCNFRDVTAQKKVELERQKITADLIQRNKNLEQFTYIVSHNLRAPVANIKGLSYLLTDSLKYLEAGDRETLRALSRSADQLDKVILDLNHMLQVSTDVNAPMEEICFADIVEEIKSAAHNLISASSATISYDFSLVKTIQGLKSYIYSIFFNLIINGIKYGKANLAPQICITSGRAGEEVWLSFKDQGRGIDLERHGSDLFGLYKRFDFSVEGKGIGLFMVKQQVEALGGRISVHSLQGEGSEFNITLPLKQSLSQANN